MPDYYEILGVSRGASVDEIRKAYFQIARDRHPDRFTDPGERRQAEEAFTQATAAFNTLGNRQARAEYDAALARPPAGPPEEQARQAFERALAAEKASQNGEALELLRTATHFAPEQARYHEALGRILARDPRMARQAAESLERAARLDPRNAGAQLALARLYQAQGMQIRSRKAAEAAVRLAPHDPEVARVAAEVGVGGDQPRKDGGEGPAGAIRGRA